MCQRTQWHFLPNLHKQYLHKTIFTILPVKCALSGTVFQVTLLLQVDILDLCHMRIILGQDSWVISSYAGTHLNHNQVPRQINYSNLKKTLNLCRVVYVEYSLKFAFVSHVRKCDQSYLPLLCTKLGVTNPEEKHSWHAFNTVKEQVISLPMEVFQPMQLTQFPSMHDLTHVFISLFQIAFFKLHHAIVIGKLMKFSTNYWPVVSLCVKLPWF